MQAILKFNLPEDRELFEYHCKVMEYRSLINDFRNLLRGWGKSDYTPDFKKIKDDFNSLLAGIGYE